MNPAAFSLGLHSWSSRFLKSRSFSNFSRPGLRDLNLGGVDCLGGVLGGYLGLGGDVFSAYDLILDFGCEAGDYWCLSGPIFGSEDPQVGTSSHLFPQSATRPLTLRY